MDKVKFVAATNNKNKLKEFARILEPLNIELLTASQCGGEDIDPVEDGETFEANAIIKAKAFAKALGMPALADDSGLCVDALDGAPGVYSARYSGEGDAANNALLLRNLEGVPMENAPRGLSAQSAVHTPTADILPCEENVRAGLDLSLRAATASATTRFSSSKQARASPKFRASVRIP